MFLFTTTLKLFGAEICVAEARQALNNWPCVFLSFKENKLEKAASLQVLLFITFKLEINTGGPYLNLGLNCVFVLVFFYYWF
jgi:hypothetical protein